MATQYTPNLKLSLPTQGDVLLRVRGASAADATQWAFKTEYMSSTGAVI